MNIWIVWAQYHDKSNDPEFLCAFTNKNKAEQLLNMISKTNPTMNVIVSEIWLALTTIEING